MILLFQQPRKEDKTLNHIPTSPHVSTRPTTGSISEERHNIYLFATKKDGERVYNVANSETHKWWRVAGDRWRLSEAMAACVEEAAMSSKPSTVAAGAISPGLVLKNGCQLDPFTNDELRLIRLGLGFDLAIAE